MRFAIVIHEDKDSDYGVTVIVVRQTLAARIELRPRPSRTCTVKMPVLRVLRVAVDAADYSLAPREARVISLPSAPYTITWRGIWPTAWVEQERQGS